MASIKLFTFNELYSVEGLKKIDNKFLSVVKEKNLKLYEKLITLRKTPSSYSAKNDFSFFKDLNKNVLSSIRHRDHTKYFALYEIIFKSILNTIFQIIHS